MASTKLKVIVIGRAELERTIRGALKATANDHGGTIETPSAMKRIMGQIDNRATTVDVDFNGEDYASKL